MNSITSIYILKLVVYSTTKLANGANIFMKTLYVNTQAETVDQINLHFVDHPMPALDKDECLIKVASSGVNPSDALAIKGYFSYATFPRIPGRDFAGTVVEGPQSWVGKSVWGTGGAAGISFNGTQAEYIKLSTDALSEIPLNIDIIAAGAQPLPYVTAYYSLVKRAQMRENETVLVIGALGQVGRAAMSICAWKKCHAIALVKGKYAAEKAKQLGWDFVDSDDRQLSEKILAANSGRPIDIILNTTGNIYWENLLAVLSAYGRITTIGAKEGARDVNVNLFDLYRANQEIIGVNTVSLDFSDNAALLNELKEGFEKNELIPLEVDLSMIFLPENANKAYKAVLSEGSKKRIVIKF